MPTLSTKAAVAIVFLFAALAVAPRVGPGAGASPANTTPDAGPVDTSSDVGPPPPTETTTQPTTTQPTTTQPTTTQPTTTQPTTTQPTTTQPTSPSSSITTAPPSTEVELTVGPEPAPPPPGSGLTSSTTDPATIADSPETDNPATPAGNSPTTSSAPPVPADADPAGPVATITPDAPIADGPEPLGAGPALGLPDEARREGQQLGVHLVPECAGAERARVDPAGIEVSDLDADPRTFTVDTGVLGLGTHLVQVVCPRGLTTRTRVLVYRQNGAERGEANSIVLAGGLGLASTAVVVGPPGPNGRRRDR